MEELEQAYRLLPDTVIITDSYWYILDYNRPGPFEGLKKGRNLTRYMPDCRDRPGGVYACNGRVFQRSISDVRADGVQGGHVVYLVDITERERLVEQQRQRRAELDVLTKKQMHANAELEEYARQVRVLTDYEEQLRIARTIHDGAGHAITALNTISRMCLQLRDSDMEKYNRLIDEGIAICRCVEKGRVERRYDSLAEMLEAFRNTSPFPIRLRIAGEEPPFAAGLYDVILGVCREAYHNTLSHSLADRLTIEVQMTKGNLTLRITDNGHFHGILEKGFGLKTMEENVRNSGGQVYFEAEEGKGFGVVVKWGGALHEREDPGTACGRSSVDDGGAAADDRQMGGV